MSSSDESSSRLRIALLLSWMTCPVTKSSSPRIYRVTQILRTVRSRDL
jgi:hypothetical protein